MRIIQIGLDKTTLAFLRERGIVVEDSGSISNVEELEDWLATGQCEAVAVNLNFGQFGIYAARHLRNKRIDTPVVGISLATTDRPWSEERAIFLESGGDDLLRGPANPRELVASLFAVSRRYNGSLMQVFETSHGEAHLKVNLTTRACQVNGRELDMQPQVCDLLLYLAAHPGRVVSKESLLVALYPLQPDDMPQPKIIDVYLSHLRKAMSSIHPDGKGLIETVWGEGCRLQPVPLKTKAASAA